MQAAASSISGMEQGDAEAKQGGGDQSQRSLKGEKAAEPESPKLRDTKKLIEFMESHYDEFVARVQSYHAIYQLMHGNVLRGTWAAAVSTGYRRKGFLIEEAYKKHHTSEGVVKEELVAMSKEVVKVESFSLGFLGWFLLHAPVPDAAPHQLAFDLGWRRKRADR
ncbi:hypothetical protein PVAP13_5KG767701 [Panicum virgatum]|uniref:Uncharacterized protein n=1 Tax=Panicum virgatum TaxID=38727 RepID=A0A8T0T229_PANVG|nr:hypothetical protein PVAP13_5KG767701 [Panicum virgatum]